MAATDRGLGTTLRSPRRSVLADERLLPVVPALAPLLPNQGLRRGSTVAVDRSAALALALVAGASAAGFWVAAVGLPDLGILAAAETGVALERLALVPSPGPRAWPTVVAALLDAIDVVLVRSPPGRPGPPPGGQGPRAGRGPGPPRPLAGAARPAPGRHRQRLARPRPGPRHPPGPPGRGGRHRPRLRQPRAPGPPLAPRFGRRHRRGGLAGGCRRRVSGGAVGRCRVIGDAPDGGGLVPRLAGGGRRGAAGQPDRRRPRQQGRRLLGGRPGRGRPARPAPPRGPEPLPRAGAAGRRPGPGRPRLRAGAGGDRAAHPLGRGPPAGRVRLPGPRRRPLPRGRAGPGRHGDRRRPRGRRRPGGGPGGCGGPPGWSPGGLGGSGGPPGWSPGGSG